MKEWVAQDDENIAVIHCKAGKGRTGVMICNWLMYSGEWNSPEDSMAYYAAMRTYNMKGVTIPSQIRYIHYFAKSLVRNELPVKQYRRARLKRIVLHTVPLLDGNPLYFEVFERDPTCLEQPIDRRMIYRYVGDEASAVEVRARLKAQKQRLKDEPAAYGAADAHLRDGAVERLQFTLDAGGLVDWSTGNAAAPAAVASSGTNGMKQKPTVDEADMSEGGNVQSPGLCYTAVPHAPATADADGLQFGGDVVIQFYEGKPGKSEKLFFFWINSHHVEEQTFLEKKLVDKAHKDKKHQLYCENFHVELQFSSLDRLDVSGDGDTGIVRSASVGGRKSAAADMLASRRGYERDSRPGTLETEEHVLNGGEQAPTLDAFFQLNREGLVDSSACALAAFLCERATEALEKHAETDIVGGAALAAAATSSLPSGSLAQSLSEGVSAPGSKELGVSTASAPASSSSSAPASSASASRLRMVGMSGLKKLAGSPEFAKLVETARVLQHIKTVPAMRHAERVSFWLNVYNALSVHANAVYLPTTLRERLHTQLYYKYQVGADKYSLAEIQIFMLRNTLPQSIQLERLLRERLEWRSKKAVLPGALLTSEPMVTFCVNNGVPSAGEIVPYWPDNIEEQLKRAARRYFARLFRVDRREKRAMLPRQLSWVRDDFGRDRAERLAMLGDLMESDQRRALFECGKRANGILYVYNDQSLGFACPPLKGASLQASGRRSSAVDVVRRSSDPRARHVSQSMSGRTRKGAGGARGSVKGRATDAEHAAAGAKLAMAHTDDYAGMSGNAHKKNPNHHSDSDGAEHDQASDATSESEASDGAAANDDNGDDEQESPPGDKQPKRNSDKVGASTKLRK